MVKKSALKKFLSSLKQRELWRLDALYVLFALVLYFDVIFLGRRFFYKDLQPFFYPLGELFSRALWGNGSFLWDSSIDGGVPLAARWTYAVFYPPHWLFAILQADTAIALILIFHFIVAAMAAFHLSLRFCNNRLSAWIAGLSFGFCGYILSMYGGGIYLYGSALLPLSLLVIIRLIEKPSLMRILQLSFVFALQIVVADPQTFFFELLIFVPFSILAFEHSNLARLRLAGRTAMALFFALGISACQVIPAIEFLSRSVRASGVSSEEAGLWAFHPLRLIEVIVPGVFGGISPENTFWGQSLVNAFTGIPWVVLVNICLLLAIGILYTPLSKGSRKNLALLLITLFFLLMAMGDYTPVFGIVRSILPLADGFRYPEKYMLFVSFGLTILGSIGLARVIETLEDVPRQRVSLNPAFIALAIIVSLSFLGSLVFNSNISSTGEKIVSFISPNLAGVDIIKALATSSAAFLRVFGLAIALLLLLLGRNRVREGLIRFAIVAIAVTDVFSARFFIVNVGYDDWVGTEPILCEILPSYRNGLMPMIWRSQALNFQEPEGNFDQNESIVIRQHRWEWDTLQPNSAAPFCARYLRGYEAANLAQYWFAYNLMVYQNSQKLFDLFGAEYLFASPAELNKDKFPLVKNYEEYFVTVHKNPTALPYAYTVSKIKSVSGGKEALFAVMDSGFDIHKEAAFESSEPFQESGAVSPSIQVLSYKSGKVVLKADFDSEGYLILHESFYPGWKCKIDNAETQIWRANGLFMGVKVPKGAHEITFSFKPEIQAIANSLSTIFILAALLLFVVSKRVLKQSAG